MSHVTCVSESSLLLDVAYVLCLDTIGSTDQLQLHVSKPPKEDSAGGVFLKVNSCYFGLIKCFELDHTVNTSRISDK